MRVLAVDTTTSRGSVAALVDGEVRAEARVVSPDSHSGRVLPAVAFVLESAGLAATEIDGFAVAVGPGSFTGMRVGISTVQGLALAAGRPCVGVSALDALAACIEAEAACLVAMMDAYRGEVFVGVYDGAARQLGPPAAEAPDAALDRVPPLAAFVGDGAARYRALIQARRPQALFPRRSLFLAPALARLAASRLEAGEGVPPSALRPLYLREADIRKPRP